MSHPTSGPLVPPEQITPCAESGRLAVCRRGFIGRIQGRAQLPWGEGFVGVSVFTGKPWSSTQPLLLSEEDTMALTCQASAGPLPRDTAPPDAAR
jgi:hypothetical protein